MGMFERFDNVHNPTTAWELADRCTACNSTGYVQYPVNVGVDETEADPCPLGCADPDELMDADFLYLGLAPDPQKRDWERWQWDALNANRLPTLDGDPFFVHTKRWNGNLTDSLPGQGERRKNFDITTDVPALGLLLKDGHKVSTCRVPAYLVGRPLSTDPLEVEYDYLGSKVTVRYSPMQARKFRFAHAWDDDFSTASLLG